MLLHPHIKHTLQPACYSSLHPLPSVWSEQFIECRMISNFVIFHTWRKMFYIYTGIAKNIPWQGLLFALFTSIMFGTQVRHFFRRYFSPLLPGFCHLVWRNRHRVFEKRRGGTLWTFSCYFNLIVGKMGEEIEVEEYTGWIHLPWRL